MERGSAGGLSGIRNCYESVIPERILSHRTGVSGSDLYQSGGGVKNPELHLKQNKRSMELLIFFVGIHASFVFFFTVSYAAPLFSAVYF